MTKLKLRRSIRKVCGLCGEEFFPQNKATKYCASCSGGRVYYQKHKLKLKEKNKKYYYKWKEKPKTKEESNLINQYCNMCGKIIEEDYVVAFNDLGKEILHIDCYTDL